MFNKYILQLATFGTHMNFCQFLHVDSNLYEFISVEHKRKKRTYNTEFSNCVLCAVTMNAERGLETYFL